MSFINPELSKLPRELTSLWYSEPELDAAIHAIPDVRNSSELLAHVESFEQADESTEKLATALGLIPPDAIVDAYGLPVMCWVMANTSSRTLREDLMEEVCIYTGLDFDFMHRAYLLSLREPGQITKGSDMLKQYALMDSVMTSDFYNTGVTSLLVPNDVALSEKRMHKYSVKPIRVQQSAAPVNPFGDTEGYEKPDNNGIYYDIYLDSPVGILLSYQNKPQALVGLSLDTQSDELFINQIQGVNGMRVDPNTRQFTSYQSARGLAPLDWTQTMIAIATAFGKSIDIEKMSIQSAANNIWTKKYDRSTGKPRLALSAAQKNYDQAAIKAGFSLASDGNWHKDLQDQP